LINRRDRELYDVFLYLYQAFHFGIFNSGRDGLGRG